MVEIDSVFGVPKLRTEYTLPSNVERLEETSSTELLVAYAPKLTGEYGEIRKGLLLLDAK